MLFRELSIGGSFAVDLERKEDERGFFARSFDEGEFAARGLVSRFTQSSVSFNRRRGTVRGLHFQAAPHGETKLVRCVAGAVFDVVVDLRRDSPTYLKSAGIELSADNRTALYIPAGLAHGFQTLRDGQGRRRRLRGGPRGAVNIASGTAVPIRSILALTWLDHEEAPPPRQHACPPPSAPGPVLRHRC